jgi:hypothetical protein
MYYFIIIISISTLIYSFIYTFNTRDIYVYICLHIFMSKCVCVRLYICMCMNICVHVNICIYIYTHILFLLHYLLQPATGPEDILWENISMPLIERVGRVLLTTFLTIFILAVSYIAIYQGIYVYIYMNLYIYIYINNPYLLPPKP